MSDLSDPPASLISCRWFDVMFLVAATCTMAVLYLAHKRDKGEQVYKDE